MNTHNYVYRFFKKCGILLARDKNTLAEIYKLLMPDEKLVYAADGILKCYHENCINGVCLVILTNRRVIFFRKNQLIGNFTLKSTRINKILSASYSKGLLFSHIIIKSSDEKSEIQSFSKRMAEKFIFLVQDQIRNAKMWGDEEKNEDLATRTNGLKEIHSLVATKLIMK